MAWFKQKDEKAQSEAHVSEIEFVGGPLDGLREVLHVTPDQVQDIAIIPINRNIVGAIIGVRFGPKSAATSAAIYALDLTAPRLRYHFLGARSAEEFDLETWVG